jgi:CBS domain-containing protein
MVVTVGPDHSVTELLDLLAKHKVGALVVSSDGKTVEGIVSERDVVRELQHYGAALLDAPVRDIMTSAVHTFTKDIHLDDVMRVMTERRFRHVPIVNDAGELAGIVSIGDVVKHRIDQLEVERDSLTAYITG